MASFPCPAKEASISLSQLNFPGVCVRPRVCQGLGAGALLGPEQPAPHPAGHTETQCWDAGGLGERTPRRKEVRGLFGSSSCMKGWWGGTLMGKDTSTAV